MKIIVNDVKAFTNALKLVAKATAKNETMPILNHVALVVTGHTATLTGTNLETCFEADVTGTMEIKTPGAICLPVKPFMGILKGEQKRTEIRTEGTWITIGNTKIAGMSAEGFPFLLTEKFTVYNTITITDLATHLKMVDYARGEGDARYMLNGVHFDIKDKLVVATDGYRLAFSGIKIHGKVKNLPAEVSPNVTFMDSTISLLKVLPDPEKIECSRDRWRFVWKNGQLLARVIDGQYPNYKLILPTGSDAKLTVRREELIEELKKVRSVLTRDKVREVLLTMKDPQLLNIITDIGEYRTIIPCRFEGYLGGNKLALLINPDYLLDALMPTSKEMVTLEMNTNNAPVMIIEGEYKALVMPLRLPENMCKDCGRTVKKGEECECTKRIAKPKTVQANPTIKLSSKVRSVLEVMAKA